ncbi:asparaginyl-tRNA synthetase [Microbotryum lychnidis-dioicae p1A1 Lamole]|uniref:asparagine--tRNA ligase n=1 Tax=Microbotryum lychnidis-dioicae (strain p1A1 Lamole / MvSl-1064) TaxID=683840 RepID=U5HJ37_USTV1|nr:asparaginyl-tRNA synthetase [Microbotryum lychnidis-dioicae p1A1 Lamole]|eukprot:KDE02418.1 asparaginyl-tRNA synthetase [Microbotryum lychnidis-dioicae p1A1 Lamole]
MLLPRPWSLAPIRRGLVSSRAQHTGSAALAPTIAQALALALAAPSPGSDLTPKSHQDGEITTSSSVAAAEAKTTTISGWIRSCRRQKNVTFAVLNDGSDVKGIQAVMAAGLDHALAVGCSAALTGRFVPSRGRGQEMEFQVDQIQLLGSSDAETYPIPNTKQGVPLPILRRNAHLRPRTPSIAAMLRVRSELALAAAQHFRSQDFVRVEPPLITSSDCEGAGEVFRVESGSPPGSTPSSSFATATIPTSPPPPPRPSRYLTVSSQLHLEALASSLARVWTLSPTFRAEESDTSRHLQEFYMLEAELGFLPARTPDANQVVMNVVEDLVRHLVTTAITMKELEAFVTLRPTLLDELNQLAPTNKRYARMTYTEAIQVLQHQEASFPGTFTFEPVWGKGLQTEHERWLAETCIRGPLFVTDYPKGSKPFYMLSNDEPSRETVACFDLLVPRLGELVGGSLREHRAERMEQALDQHGLNKERYGWYLDLRRFGTTQHGGFGLGWERLIAIVTGQENVRECIAFPRAAEGSRF